MSLNDDTRAAVKARLDAHGGTYRAALAFVMAARAAAAWNARWPVGTPCILEVYLGGPRRNTVTRSLAWPGSNGQASVKIAGHSGSYGLEWLTPGKQLEVNA